MTQQQSKLWHHKASYVFWQLFKDTPKTWVKYKLCLDIAHLIELTV